MTKCAFSLEMPITKVTCTKGMWYKKDQQLCGLQTVYQYSISCLWQWIIGLSFKCQAWEFSGFQSISGIYIVLFWIVWQCALCSTVIWRGSRVMYVALCYIAMTSFCVMLLGMHPPVHDDVIKWKHFPHYWPFVQGIHWSLVNSPYKGQLWCFLWSALE